MRLITDDVTFHPLNKTDWQKSLNFFLLYIVQISV